jgi:DNA-binding NtrC family response regulator
MNTADLRILLVCEDGKESALLAKQLVTELNADISMVDTIEDAIVLTTSNTYDAIIATSQLSDGSGLSLLSEDEAACPVIILENSNDIEQAMTAVRHGAADVLASPVEPKAFVTAVRRVSKRYRRHRMTATRTKRLRKMTSRLVRDRRELRKRMDLLCRDLVQAYQKLAEKVVEIQETATPDA